MYGRIDGAFALQVRALALGASVPIAQLFDACSSKAHPGVLSSIARFCQSKTDADIKLKENDTRGRLQALTQQPTNLAQVIGDDAAAKETQETDAGCWYILMSDDSFKGFGVARNNVIRRCLDQKPTAYAFVGTMSRSLRGILSSGEKSDLSNCKDIVAEGTESMLSVLMGGLGEGSGQFGSPRTHLTGSAFGGGSYCAATLLIFDLGIDPYTPGAYNIANAILQRHINEATAGTTAMRTLQDQVVALGRGSHASEKSQAAALTILNARIDDTATTAEEKRAL